MTKKPPSIKELRESASLPVQDINYDREEPAPVEEAWETQALVYFKERMDKIDELLIQVLTDIDSLNAILMRIEDALAERSEAGRNE